MASKCDFCQNKLKANDLINVKEVVIDKNPGIIKLTDVLLDLYFCELDVSKICSECMDTISKQFIFKQKLRKNIKMPQSNTIIQISKFLSKVKESVVSEHFDVLSIYPNNRKSYMDTIQKYSPIIYLDKTANNKKVTVERKPVVTFSPVIQTNHYNVNKPTTQISMKNYESSSSDNNSDDSNYDSHKSSKKRKKGQKSRKKAKKQKTSHNETIVKQEPITENAIHEKIDELVEKYKRKQSRRRSSVRNSSRLIGSLNDEQKEWLRDVIKNTERNGKYYSCKFCFKDLGSSLAIHYHYVNRHLLKNMTKKQVWVSHKVKECMIEVKREEDGIRMTQYRCTECSKIYTSQPSIRYHLAQHLKDDYDETFDITNYKFDESECFS